MKTFTVISREHSICCGHTVTGHEGKCRHLHGHNYKIDIIVGAPELDDLGRVLDFSVIKSECCDWLERHWDHKFLIWFKDPRRTKLKDMDPDGVVVVPFNPTAENMAAFLVVKFQELLRKYDGVHVRSIRVHETDKCSAMVGLLS